MFRAIQNTVQPVKGSLAKIAEQNNQSIAETFINADVVIIVDTSGSMDMRDGNERNRYQIACDELAKLQAELAGRIAVLVFSDSVMFCPNGVPAYLGCGTAMSKALEFAKVADIPPMRFIVIADGYPDNREEALRVARTFESRIDTIYVGPESDASAKAFMQELANVKQGQYATDKSGLKLSDTTRRLLLK